MALPFKLVTQEIFMAALKQVPLLGPAMEVVDSIQKRHELLQFKQEISGLEGKMQRVVREELQVALGGLSRRDLGVADFTTHIKNLMDLKQNGWSPALYQGLIERSLHWAELCKNPSHYGAILDDHQKLDPSKLHVFIDADNTRILELTPFALHALLARQRDAEPKTTIRSSTDVWAFVTPARGALPPVQTQVRAGPMGDTFRVYKELGIWHYQHNGEQLGSRFLILASDVAQAAGQSEEAERLRAKILQRNPHHMLKPFASCAAALRNPDVQSYVSDLRKSYPPEEAAELLRSIQSEKEPS